jgi:hypothetical protein
MIWSNVFGLTLGFLVCVVVLARIERKWLWLGVVIFVAPLLLIVAAWATLFGQWPETMAALVIAAVLGAAWWFTLGRKWGRAPSDTIKVWGQDAAPRPKAALQAEIDTLREEKERLEAELRRLREGKQTKDD